MNKILALSLLTLVGYSAFSQCDREDLLNAIEVAFQEPGIAHYVYATPADGIHKATIYANDLFLRYFPSRYDSERTSELSLGLLRKKAGIYVVRDGLIYGEADVIITLGRLDIGAQGNTVELELLTSSITKGGYPCAHVICTLEKKGGIWERTASDAREVKCDESNRPLLGVVDLR
jgi:hypothetical protein